MRRKQPPDLEKMPYQIPVMLMSFLISLVVSFTYKRKALLSVFVYLSVYTVLYCLASYQQGSPLQITQASTNPAGLQTVLSLYLQCVLPLFILYVVNLDTSAFTYKFWFF